MQNKISLLLANDLIKIYNVNINILQGHTYGFDD